jgi:hypothetical protein
LDDAADKGRGIGLNSEALAFRRRGEESGDDGKLDASSRFAHEIGVVVCVGEGAGDSLRAVMYEEPPVPGLTPSGEVIGREDFLKIIASGELGAEVGVSGLFGMRRAEWLDAREDGRDIGRLVGVRKRKGTPATSSRCLCMRSRTLCSS